MTADSEKDGSKYSCRTLQRGGEETGRVGRGKTVMRAGRIKTGGRKR